MINDILTFAQTQIAQGKKIALITVTEITGSSPASVGQIMAVLADGRSSGTVGGGETEHLAKQKAIEAIKNGEKIFSFAFDHGQSGMVCGGSMSGFGCILGDESHLYIFGGGHIGQCLAPLALATGFFVTVIEDRPEFENNFSNVRYTICNSDEYEKEIELKGHEYAVICTRGHKTDDAALRFCLSKKLRYTGMIGSTGKVKVLFDKLKEEGYTEDVLKKVYAPIGLDIASSVPSEIAVSVMAEILLIKNKGSPEHKNKLA